MSDLIDKEGDAEIVRSNDLISRLRADAEWNSAPQLNDPAVLKTAALEREAADALESQAKRIADLEHVRGDLQTVSDVLRDFEAGTVHEQAQLAVARIAELEADWRPAGI